MRPHEAKSCVRPLEGTVNKLSIDPTNGACGAIFVAAGLFFGYQSLG